MIASFKTKETKQIFEEGLSRRFSGMERVIVRRLQQLDLVGRLEDLRFPPGNRLEALKGDREGQHSIRINGQFQICFRWAEDGVEDVEIVDYH